jgi:hypothetical protein
MQYTALDRQRHKAGIHRHPYSVTLEKQAERAQAAAREAELERASLERVEAEGAGK